MKFSGFILIAKTGKNEADWKYFAEVTVTTGVLWWRKSARRKIQRNYGSYWIFADTGEFAPDGDIEALARAYQAQLDWPKLKTIEKED